jgi:hypothetical protein
LAVFCILLLKLHMLIKQFVFVLFSKLYIVI